MIRSFTFLSLLLALLLPGGLQAATVSQPNIILIFTDDQGYQDLGCFGSKKIKTPNLDKMALEGLRLTNFYAQPVCGVSRAALMTGSYPIRIAEPNNVKQLHTVPHPQEITMAEVLKSAGYSTGIIGKWHLVNKMKGGGYDPSTMPNAQGFDYFYGTPVFNGYTVHVDDVPLRVPILRNDEVAVKGVESWDNITADYTKEAINYIEKNKEKPFFLYLAHNMPHIPVGASKDFKGKSEYGPYGDTIEEIDWSTGKIFDKLKELGIDDNTLVVFTSDNGPWVETTRGMKTDGAPFIPRNHSGSAAPFRGWKMSAWDGGCRVPFIARWPKNIVANRVSDEILSTMDLLPTFAKLAGAKLPADRIIDGHDATSFLLGKSETSPRDDYFYYSGCLLTGVRSDHWKLVLPRPENPAGTGWWGRMIEEVKEVHLFDLDVDPGEITNVADKHPDLVAKLMAKIKSARSEMGDMNVVGSGARFFDKGPRRIPGAKRKPAAAKPAPQARVSSKTKRGEKPKIALETSNERKLGLVYKTVGKRKLEFDMYYPEVAAGRPCPVIVYTHGGGWAAGSRFAASTGSFAPLFKALLKKGFCIVSVDYRLYSREGTVRMRDCVIDSKDAIRYLVKNSEALAIDPGKLFVFGDSAGGQIAQMLLLSPSESLLGDEGLSDVDYKVVAGLSWYGPCDFEEQDLFNHDDRPGFKDRFGPRIVGIDGSPEDKLRLYREMSPINYLKKDSPPLLMIQGDKDTTIPVKHAYYMAEKAMKLEAPVKTLIVKNAGHNWRRVDAAISPTRDEINQATVRFFVDQLK